MPRTLYFITHPDVQISKQIPVPEWPLSETGRSRMRASLRQQWISDISAIYCSTEQKAIDGAEILAAHLSVPIRQVPELGENDRSATGFLPPDEFQAVANEFFRYPAESIRGWETAREAQERIVAAVMSVVESEESRGDIAVVSHGGVGTLLYCALSRNEISRRWDQPPNGGGNYCEYDITPLRARTWWKAIDDFNVT